jgi:hypothetical protein
MVCVWEVHKNVCLAKPTDVSGLHDPTTKKYIKLQLPKCHNGKHTCIVETEPPQAQAVPKMTAKEIAKARAKESERESGKRESET